MLGYHYNWIFLLFHKGIDPHFLIIIWSRCSLICCGRFEEIQQSFKRLMRAPKTPSFRAGGPFEFVNKLNYLQFKWQRVLNLLFFNWIRTLFEASCGLHTLRVVLYWQLQFSLLTDTVRIISFTKEVVCDFISIRYGHVLYSIFTDFIHVVVSDMLKVVLEVKP
jgi:hypothetical protein